MTRRLANDLNDAALLKGIASGKTEAFEAAYREHADAVYGYACALVGRGAEAEDMTHDVFLNLARKTPRLTTPGALRGYLLTSVRNRAADRRKSFAARFETASPGAFDRPGSTTTPDDASSRADDGRRVNRALRELPAAQEEAVLLRAIGGLAYDEIAALVGAPSATIRNRFRAGVAKLKALLQGAGFDG